MSRHIAFYLILLCAASATFRAESNCLAQPVVTQDTREIKLSSETLRPSDADKSDTDSTLISPFNNCGDVPARCAYRFPSVLLSSWNVEHSFRHINRDVQNADAADLLSECECWCAADYDPRHTLDYDWHIEFSSFLGDLFEDAVHFYSRDSLTLLGASIGVGAILANTSIDQSVQDWFPTMDPQQQSQYHWGKVFGENWILPPAVGLTWVITEWLRVHTDLGHHPINLTMHQWGRQTVRAWISEAVPVLALQQIIGASRPGDDPQRGSRWDPFDADNGVSGHAALGATPFLVAAYMSKHRFWKGVFFAGSFLTSYSRLHDNAHYLSQVVIGWSIAALAVEATIKTERSNRQYHIVPLANGRMVGIGCDVRW